MTDFPDFTKTGWFWTMIAATWGVVLRVLIGRHEAFNRRQEARMQVLEEDMSEMKVQLANIAGVLQERGRIGRQTWPHGHE